MLLNMLARWTRAARSRPRGLPASFPKRHRNGLRLTFLFSLSPGPFPAFANRSWLNGPGAGDIHRPGTQHLMIGLMKPPTHRGASVSWDATSPGAQRGCTAARELRARPLVGRGSTWNTYAHRCSRGGPEITSVGGLPWAALRMASELSTRISGRK